MQFLLSYHVHVMIDDEMYFSELLWFNNRLLEQLRRLEELNNQEGTY